MGAIMTRQDFRVIASAIQLTRQTIANASVPYDAESAIALLTLVMADKLAPTNPNFSYAYFYDACNLDPK